MVFSKDKRIKINGWRNCERELKNARAITVVKNEAILFTLLEKDRAQVGVFGQSTGFGLAVVQGIFKRCNGAIHVYSEPGMGTQVHVYLPIMKRMKEIDSGDLSKPIQGGTDRILIVDDDEEEEMIVKMEIQMLERLGYHVPP